MESIPSRSQKWVLPPFMEGSSWIEVDGAWEGGWDRDLPLWKRICSRQVVPCLPLKRYIFWQDGLVLPCCSSFGRFHFLKPLL